jgi:hypothetical protein
VNGKEESYLLLVAPEGGHVFMTGTRTDEDLVEKYMRCREDKFSYFTWNYGCIPMRHLIGITIQN